MQIKIIDIDNFKEFHEGDYFNNQRIAKILYDCTASKIHFLTQSGALLDVPSNYQAFPEIADNIFKHDYVVDKLNNLDLVDCSSYKPSSMRIVGSKYKTPEVNLAFNLSKKWYYNKFKPKDMITYKLYDILYVFHFLDESIQIYTAFEFFSDLKALPIASMDKTYIEVGNSKIKHNLIDKYDEIPKLIPLKKKSIAVHATDIIYSALPEKLYEVNLKPQEVLEFLKVYKGYFKLFVPDSNISLRSEFRDDAPILIQTKFNVINALHCDYVELKTIGERINDGTRV